MNAKRKKKILLGYGVLGLTLIALGVAFVKPISSSNFLIRARADMGNLSVTFSRSTCTNSKGSYNNSDYILTTGLQQSGLSVQASLTNGYAITSGQDVVRFSGNSSTLIFSIPSNVAGVTNFRKIKSLSFVYNGSYNVGNNYFDVIFSASSDFSNPDTINVKNDASATPNIGNAHYVKMIGDKSHYAYFASIVIHYSCSDEPEVKTLSSISVSGAKTKFSIGDTFSFGGTVTAHYSDSSSADVTESATFSGYNMNEEGVQTVTVAYTEGGVTKTITYGIEVTEAPIPSKTLSYLLAEKSYVVSGKISIYLYELTLDFANKIATARRCLYEYGPSALGDFYTQTFDYSVNDSTVTLSITSVGSPTQTGGSQVATASRLKANGNVSVAITNDEISTLDIGLYNSSGILQGTISL